MKFRIIWIIQQNLFFWNKKFTNYSLVNVKILINYNWNTSQPLSLFPGASECFSQLQSLLISIDSKTPDSLHGMTQICTNLNELIIFNRFQNLPGLISLIDAQKNLKNIISSSFLTSLINLKNLSIYNCVYDYDDDIRKVIQEFTHYLKISEFSELQTIDFYGLSCIEVLAILIGKTKGNISQIIINTVNKTAAENSGMSIANNEFDSLNILMNESNNFGDELLDILTKFSPKSLIGISLSEDWKYSTNAFELFLKVLENEIIYFILESLMKIILRVIIN
ncbi:hypothetical protein GLOIN_2v1782082 [Rhizophagus clarus]|uniref:Uncharacterized protein n=1 Tax=Rhizophagus clarus TaxID=94130 RepID=A0A8H3QBD9_9GLOM|nr:hypothetical protein GLOIN_2v1782082 [Rhizophagus clarus]